MFGITLLAYTWLFFLPLLLLFVTGMAWYRFRLRQDNEQEWTLLVREMDLLVLENKSLLQDQEWMLKELHHRVNNNLRLLPGLLDILTGPPTASPSPASASASPTPASPTPAGPDPTRYAPPGNAPSTPAPVDSARHPVPPPADNPLAPGNSPVPPPPADSFPAYHPLPDGREYILALWHLTQTGTRTRARGPNTIRLDLRNGHLPPDTLDKTQILPLSLLLLEALSQALQYDFPDNDTPGILSISLLPAEQDQPPRIILSPDGQAPPPEPELRRQSSLGVRLIESLARACGAGFSILRGDAHNDLPGNLRAAPRDNLPQNPPGNPGNPSVTPPSPCKSPSQHPASSSSFTNRRTCAF